LNWTVLGLGDLKLDCSFVFIFLCADLWKIFLLIVLTWVL